ncbi:HK97 gp10 family phage protein [Spiractinospora alimapuensis]|uniref:HK97-gp10 family putative phage morphogenesis protein n=1 Tax=Spiractinospora alimapuensis TaxID=2820884 RepID=UPI001F2FCEC3|nr:HK97-gp10 family putative phage morphogenesis protein [Spiractinospora alimapuensis]QVQ51302.1 HK97 gp10 family phage protein [Spiractinospora alimapuensis]
MARSTTIVGLPELKRKLRQIGPTVVAEAGRVVAAEAGRVEEEMSASAPRASGTLQGAIDSRQRDRLTHEVGVLGARRAWYAAMVEFGTSARPASPFAEPAARVAEARFPQEMASALNRALPPS